MRGISRPFAKPRSQSTTLPSGSPHNQCWYVWTIAHVKSKYDLTADRAEYDVLHQSVLDCYFDGQPVSTGIEK